MSNAARKRSAELGWSSENQQRAPRPARRRDDLWGHRRMQQQCGDGRVGDVDSCAAYGEQYAVAGCFAAE